MNTTENNELIAKFMGWSLEDGNLERFCGNWISPTNTIHKSTPFFNSDWNHLMEVVEKIENLTTKDNFVIYDFTIYSDAVIISDQQEKPLIIINKSEEIGILQKEPIVFEYKIEAVYNACIEFIKWYNQQKK